MRILLTLDYELYNGISGGTVQNCLITPMNHLLPILKKHNAKITLFVDACFLLRLNELRVSDTILNLDWNAITTQLKELSDNGHDIQLHLHPQWLQGDYKDGLWNSNLSEYKLSDLSEAKARQVFKNGCLLLKEITGKPPIAFRAGDYCAQTFTKLTDAFDENGILIDSSVLRLKKEINAREWFDYMVIPSKQSYKFSQDITKEDAYGKYTEISIPTYRHSKISLIMKKKVLSKRGLSNIPWGDGKSSTGGMMEKGIHKFLAKVKLYLKPSRFAMSLDGIACGFLYDNYKDSVSEHQEYVMIMGHPKTFSPLSLQLYDEFLSKVSGEAQSVVVSDLINNK